MTYLYRVTIVEIINENCLSFEIHRHFSGPVAIRNDLVAVYTMTREKTGVASYNTSGIPGLNGMKWDSVAWENCKAIANAYLDGVNRKSKSFQWVECHEKPQIESKT